MYSLILIEHLIPLLIFILIMIIITVLYFKHETKSLKIEKVIIKTNKLDNNFRVVQLSDLHLKRIGRLEKKIYSVLNKLDFDILVITGDFVNDEKYLPVLDDFLKSVNKTKPVITVLGNHDHRIDVEKIIKVMEKNKIKLLNNENITTNKDNDKINIIGVDTPDLGYDNISQAVGSLDLNDSFNIILSHTYEIINKLHDSNKFDLILAGDTHGGQINLPFLKKFVSNSFELNYLSGEYKVKGDTILYINRGIGTTKILIRLRSRPEITVIDIG